MIHVVLARGITHIHTQTKFYEINYNSFTYFSIYYRKNSQNYNYTHVLNTIKNTYYKKKKINSIFKIEISVLVPIHFCIQYTPIF